MLFIQIIKNWKSSQIFLCWDGEKFWSGTSCHVIKEIWRNFVFKKQKSHTLQGKKKSFYLFITFFFTPNQEEQKSVSIKLLNWKYYPQFKSSGNTLQVSCMSDVFLNVKINTNWTWKEKVIEISSKISVKTLLMTKPVILNTIAKK